MDAGKLDIQTNSQPPLVSVLLPIYNAEKYLHDAVRSILNQTFRDFELIAFDDGSTDCSLQILRDLAAIDSRIRVYTRANQGLVPTLNEMVGLARGEFLARMDADDICMPQRFEIQIAFFKANTDHAVVGTKALLMNELGLFLGPLEQPMDHESIDRDHLHGHCSIVHPSAMMRRASLLKVGGYREQFNSAEDLDLWLRIAEIGYVANLPNVLIHYRIHSGSISATSGATQRLSARNACETAWARRNVSGIFMAEEHWRAGDDVDSRLRFTIQYGWTAWKNGYRDTWSHYALRAIIQAPLKLNSWQLLIFGLLKRPTHKGEVTK